MFFAHSLSLSLSLSLLTVHYLPNQTNHFPSSSRSISMASMASMANPYSYLSTKFPTFAIPTTTASFVSKHPLKPLSLSLAALSLPRYLRLSPAAFDGADAPSSGEAESPESGGEEEEEAEAAISSPSSNGADSGRLYVGNLPYSMNSSQLAQAFGEAGSVLSVEVIYDRVTDRSRGFGFVTMASVEEAQEAIRMFDGSQVGGRTVKVNFPQVPRGGEREVLGPRMRNMNKGYVDSPHKVYAGNLGWRLTSQDLRDAFADQPGVLSAKVIYERDTGRSRGFGFVSFETAEAAQAALDAMDGVEVEGRPLRLNMASERSPPTSPQALEVPEVVTDEADSGELLASVNT